MTFLSSRETVESLMGPSLRTQVATPAISPRQQRMRAAGIRSLSETNLPFCGKESDSTGLRRQSLDRTTSEGIHPQTQFLNQQHIASFPAPSALCSSSSKPRRRRSQHSFYNSSSDFGSRSSLAPVIETDISPREEKSLNFSLPQRRSSSESEHSISSQSAPVLKRSQADGLGLGLLLHNQENYSQSHESRSVVALADSAFLGEAESTSDMDSKLAKLSAELPSTLDTCHSTPDLTCSASFSSSSEETSRSSISSLDSLRVSDDGENRGKLSREDWERDEAAYALLLLDLSRVPSSRLGKYDTTLKSNKVLGPSSKSNKILGPESPTHISAATFEVAPTSYATPKSLKKTGLFGIRPQWHTKKTRAL